MTTTATSPVPRTTDTHRWRWVGSAIIVVLNVVLLTFVGVPWTSQEATAAVMLGAAPQRASAVAVFGVGIGSAVALSTADGKGINYRWAAAAVYPLSLPLFVTWITRIESRSLRLASWMVYALQTAQGIGYLGYFAYRSSLV